MIKINKLNQTNFDKRPIDQQMSRIRTPFILLLLLLSLFLTPANSIIKNCHYSCKYCGDAYYSHCIICQDGFSLSPIKNAQNIKQHYNTLEEHPWGTCLGILPSTNALGIFLVLIVILFFVGLRHRTIFYFLSTMQTFALFSFIEIGITNPLSYVLQSFQYFMFLTSLNRPNRTVKLQIFNDLRYRMFEFLGSYSFKDNFLPIFIFSLICGVIALVIPLFRYFSRRQDSIWSICSCKNQKKIMNYIEISSIVTFFFLIQQAVLVIAIGIFLDDQFASSPGNIALVIIYVIIFALMLVNISAKNIDLFSNKIGEQVEILKKSLIPLFVVLPIKANIAVTGIMFILAAVGLLFSQMSSNVKKRSEFHQKMMRRQLKYRLVELVLILMIVIYFLVQKFRQSYKASLVVGIICVVVIMVYCACILVEIGIQLYGRFCLKEDQHLYLKNQFSISSMRQSKFLSQTIENFETTEQGIMDMIFFSRNKSIQKQNPKKSNIHLTLDQLNQSIENHDINQANNQRFTPTVSPKNRQLERQLKQKTARTPKNDRSSRFKLNKVFDEQNQKQIETIQMSELSGMRKEKTENDDQTLVNYAQKTTQRSEITNKQPKTTRGQKIKTFQTIKIEINDDVSQQSPRFGQCQQQTTDLKVKNLSQKDMKLNLQEKQQGQNQEQIEIQLIDQFKQNNQSKQNNTNNLEPKS